MRHHQGVLLGAFMLFAMLCQSADADGIFVWHKGADLYEPSQKAVIFHQDGVQDLILQVQYAGLAESFCWLVPLPAAPKLAAVEKDVFAELSLYTQRRARWGYRQTSSNEPGVEVISREKVGIFDTAVLKAIDGDAIQQWLRKHEFQFPEHRKDILVFYARKKWVIVAIRIDPSELSEDVQAKLHRGTLQPLQFTFDSTEIVYPLYVSSANRGETKLLLYVLADTPVWHPWLTTLRPPKWALTDGGTIEANYQGFFETWQGRAYHRRIKSNELPELRSVLTRMRDTRLFLTRMDGVFYPSLLADDLIIKPDPAPKSAEEAESAFAARLQILYAVQAAAGGSYQPLSDSDHQAEVMRQRTINDVHSQIGRRPLVAKGNDQLDKAAVAAQSADSPRYLNVAWIAQLDEHEKQCLLRSLVILNQRLVHLRVSCSDPDAATLYYRQIDKAAMEACCHLLKRPFPKYESWQEYQRHWASMADTVTK